MADPAATEGFVPLPISIPTLPSYGIKATHYVYLRRNAPKIVTANDSRSLFVANVPVDSTEAHFRAIFASLVGVGRFEGMQFENDRKVSSADHIQARLAPQGKKRKRPEAEVTAPDDVSLLLDTWIRPVRRSGSSAVVVLVDEKSVESVLKAARKLCKTKQYPVWGEGVTGPPLGSQWLKDHNKLSYPDPVVLQTAVDAYFTKFDKSEEEAAQEAKRIRSEPDADGFVTVTKGGRATPAKMEAAKVALMKMREREQKKRDELHNFYRWQGREKAKAKQEAVKAAFAADRKQLEAMRHKKGRFVPEE